MSSKVLRVMIVGRTLTGKSTMLRLLSDFLKSKGFGVNEVWSTDGPPSRGQAAHDQAVKAIASKVGVVLAEFNEGRVLKDDADDIHIRVGYVEGAGYTVYLSIMGEVLKKDYPDTATGQERARAVAARFSAELGVEAVDMTKTRFEWSQPK